MRYDNKNDAGTSTGTDMDVIRERLEAGQFFKVACPNITEYAFDVKCRSTSSYVCPALPPYVPVRLLNRPVFYTEQVSRPFNLVQPNDYVYMCSKQLCLNKDNYSTASAGDVFAKIQLPDTGTSDKQYNTYTPNEYNIADTPIKSLSEIDVVFRDKNGAVIDFNGAEHSFGLKIVEYEEVPDSCNYSDTRGTRDIVEF
jgi:hypothetical protein